MGRLLPAAAMSDAGAFVVTWSSAPDGNQVGVFGRRFSAAGVALGAEFQIITYTTGLQSEPAVASEADGDFIVVWQGPGASDPYGARSPMVCCCCASASAAAVRR